MPLLGITLSPPELRQRCALCGASNTVALGTLVLGGGVAGRVNPNVIILPRCPSCGAQEQLVRNWDVTPSAWHGTAHSEQRAAVNALARYLKQAGQQDPLAAPLLSAETGEPTEWMNFADAGQLLLVANVPGESEWNSQVLAARNGKAPAIRYI